MSDEAGAYVPVSIDIVAKGGTPEQLVEELIAERNNYYPDWEFDARIGIIIHTTRMHAAVEHDAMATLTKLVRYRGPDKE
jgi:hypothetical protein